MNYKKLNFMVKRANLSSGFDLLPESDVEIAPAQTVTQPKVPKTPKATSLKLTTQKGKSSPAYTHEFKQNSPYNSN